MGDDLGVGLGLEDVTLGQELALQLDVVLDHPVVDDDDAALAVAMGMRVLVGRASVGGPAGVTEAEGPLDGLSLDQLLEVLELPRAAADFEPSFADDGDAGGIVAAVLELAQTLDEDFSGLSGADVSDDAAHGFRNLIVPAPRKMAGYKGRGAAH